MAVEMQIHAPKRFKGFSVGDILVDPPLALAPMEDVTSLAFRLIAKRIGGPGLMFTEFISAMAIHYGAAKTLKKMRVHPDERPLGVQIFGPNPEVMIKTAQLAESLGADLIDINMGCWVPKVCKTGAGAAVLKDPATAEAIVRAVVSSVRVPVSVKVRAGWDYSEFAAPELARRFEAAGAKMLTLHARFARQGFEGEADWKLIEELRKAVSIPLVGNGDVRCGADALRMLERTGCEAVMVGRAAISNPWSLAEIAACLRGQPAPAAPTLEQRVETALEHARLAIQFEAEACDGHERAEERVIRSLRGQLPMYVKGAPGASAVRARLTTAQSLRELEHIMGEYLRQAAHLDQPSTLVG